LAGHLPPTGLFAEMSTVLRSVLPDRVPTMMFLALTLTGLSHAFSKPSSLGILQASIASIRRGPGLRAMTMGSHAGFKLALDLGKPEAFPTPACRG
jgi:hypothetical protein